MIKKINPPMHNIEMPIGSVIRYAGNVAKGSLPSEWLLCDGSILNVAQYPELYRVLGHLYGGSKGTFNLPDYTAQTKKNVDNIKDPELDSREAPKVISTTPENDLQSHQHPYFGTSNGTSIDDTSQTKGLQYETRPTHTDINYLIKAFY